MIIKIRPELEGIDEDKFYSASDIANNGWFLWLKGDRSQTLKTVIRWLEIQHNLGIGSILKPTRIGSGPGTRWYINGKNLIKFIQKTLNEI